MEDKQLKNETFKLLKDLGLKKDENDFYEGNSERGQKGSSRTQGQNQEKKKKKTSKKLKTTKNDKKKQNNKTQPGTRKINNISKGDKAKGTANSFPHKNSESKKVKNVAKKTELLPKDEPSAIENRSSIGTGVQASPLASLDSKGQNAKFPFAELDDQIIAWYDISLPSIKKKKSKSYIKMNVTELGSLRESAQEYLEKEVHAFQKSKKSRFDGDDKWVQQVLKSGTLSDKIAAMTLLVQQSPVHQLETLDNLLKLAQTSQLRTAQMAGEALKDLFVTNLLPADRKLINFKQRPLQSPGVTPQHLVMWLFEEEIKMRYATFLGALQQALGHTVENFKRFALGAVSDLLTSHPEQEALLLSLIVNKLGDPLRKVASKASFHLQQILNEHSAMKGVVVREVQQFLHRPNVSPRAIYQAIIFLNQIYFSKEDEELTSKLVSTYLTLFERSVNSLQETQKLEPKSKTKKEGNQTKASGIEARLLSALLSGVNRAHPYLPKDHTGLSTHLEVLFRIAHSTNHRLSVQALMLLHQVVLSRAANDKVVCRFFSALYQKLLAPDIASLSQPLLLLNLLYKALKRDTCLPRVAAFCKRTLQAFSLGNSAVCAGALFMVSRILQHHSPELATKIFGKESQHNTSKGSNQEEEPVHYQHTYDPMKRDPRFAGAEKTSLWEAAFLRHHYHPSVSHFAGSLVIPPNHNVEYTGDPLVDFSLMPFLDRLAYKNAKSKTARQVSNMRRRSVPMEPELMQPVNSEDFLALSEVRADQAFFRTFFAEKATRNQSKKKKKLQEIDEDALDGQGSEEDPEEEAFAAQLAEQLMHSKAGPDYDDDEVPDFGDFSSDEDQAGGGQAAVPPDVDGDVDEFMDFDGDDDSGDDGGDGHEEFLMLNDSELGEGKEDQMDEALQPQVKRKRKKTKGDMAPDEFFADAADYAQLIEEDILQEEEMTNKDNSFQSTSQKTKRKKKKRKKSMNGSKINRA